ncbi:MAG: hypothetical protein QNK31_13140, partial [Porticoccus sp.]|nr:hypothetical protein [Porticoccus sp.]
MSRVVLVLLACLFFGLVFPSLMSTVSYANPDIWNEFKSLRLKEEQRSKAEESSHVDSAATSPRRVADERKSKNLGAEENSYRTIPNLADVVVCPKDKTQGKGTWSWYLCELKIANNPHLSPYGVDMPMSFMTPSAQYFSVDDPARIMIFMHPDEGGRGSFVTGPSSFSFRRDAVEIHNQEERYASNPGGSWWVYSGGQAGSVANYNGRRIAATIDYVLARYGNRIDLNKGLHLKGTSLGGAGVMHQSMILPKYQDKIAIVDAMIGLMIIPKCCEAQVKKAWGGRDLFPTVDIRSQWQKVQDIHFYWRGGANDNYRRFDLTFFDVCEQRKISCSAVWLQSGHSTHEKSYRVNMSLFTDRNQDISLDKILPVITNNSANYHGKLRGYHNRGISWHYGRIVDSPEKIEIPLRYVAQKNLGPDLPDQPEVVSFSITPRHIAHFNVKSGDTVAWYFAGQSGTIVVNKAGLMTIDNLKLKSGTDYQLLTIKYLQPVVVKRPKSNGIASPIVYTRVPRTIGSYQVLINGKPHTLTKADLWDTLPGVGRKFGKFNAPG